MQNDEKDEDNIDDHDDDHEITCNIEEKYLNLWSLVPSHLLHKGPDWSIFLSFMILILQFQIFDFLCSIFSCPAQAAL